MTAIVQSIPVIVIFSARWVQALFFRSKKGGLTKRQNNFSERKEAGDSPAYGENRRDV
jgi:hypothetical protein